jgi:hypothetical protein
VVSDPISREPTPDLVEQEVQQSKHHMVPAKPVAWLDFG